MFQNKVSTVLVFLQQHSFLCEITLGNDCKSFFLLGEEKPFLDLNCCFFDKSAGFSDHCRRLLFGESELSSFSHLSSFSKDGIRLVILLIMVAAKSAKENREGSFRAYSCTLQGGKSKIIIFNLGGWGSPKNNRPKASPLPHL